MPRRRPVESKERCLISEVSTSELKQVVESQHGGTATLAQSVPVKEARWRGGVGRRRSRIRLERPSYGLLRLCVVIPN